MAYSPVNAVRPIVRRKLREHLRELQPDVVHAHLYVAPLLLASIIGGTRRPAVINTVHSTKAHLPGYIFPSYRLSKRVTDRFVAQFPSNVPDLEAIGVPADHIRFVPFGVRPVEAPTVDASAARTSLGVTDATAPVILSIARLHPQRYLDVFIDALADMEDARAVLVLVGDGPAEERLRQRAEQRGVGERVLFPGRRADLATMFAAADVYVTVTALGDVGIAPLQAMTAGTCTIGWDFLGRDVEPEAVDERSLVACVGERSRLSHLLDRVLADDGLRRRLADHGRAETMRTRTDAAMVGAYEGLFEELCPA